MRGPFEYGAFDMPPCPPHFGPWDRGFGPCGRGRPPFGMNGWPHFDRHGCRPHGPPGFDRRPDWQGPPQYEEEYHGRPSPPREGRCGHQERRHGPPGHGEPGCGRHETSEEHHGPPRCGRWGSPEGRPSHHEHRGPPGCGHHGPSENRHSSPECGRRGPPDHDKDCHRGPRDHSPRGGPWRRGHHHGFGPDHHGFGFGPGPNPRDFFDWPGFGPHRSFGPGFGHRRPGPYDRPDFPSRDCEKCRSGPCCSGNRKNCHDAGRKEKGPCHGKNKDQNATDNTVLVQRIVVETAPTRPQSV